MCKGKQPACGPGKVSEAGEGSGLGALPSEMLRVLELDSGSSQSPVEAPPLDAPAHCTHTQGAETPLVPFYIQVPAPPKDVSSVCRHCCHCCCPCPCCCCPRPCHLLSCSCPCLPPCWHLLLCSCPCSRPCSQHNHCSCPHSPPALPAPSASGAPTTAHVSPAAAVASSAAASPVTADSPGADICSSPSAGSPVLTHTTPALALVLGRFVVPQQHEVLTLPSPSHQQQVDTDTMLGRVPGDPLADMIRGIEIRLDAIEEWMCRDAKWKC
jgi:hypothetical protein